MLRLVYAGWRFSFSGVIVNNISCLGVWFKSSNLGQPPFCAPSGWGLVWIFSLCNFWIASLRGVCVLRSHHAVWFVLFVRFGLFTAFFVESLILAQDERWRRA